MGFMYAYKRLEKLCGEVMNDERRITAYIEAMKGLPHGVFLVEGWSGDLKKLKHYRWIRTQISHEPDCSEENMTTPADAQWLEDFHGRIMTQTDPLALYRKATERPAVREKKKPAVQPHSPSPKPDKKPGGCFVRLLCAVFFLAAAAVCALVLKELAALQALALGALLF